MRTIRACDRDLVTLLSLIFTDVVAIAARHQAEGRGERGVFSQAYQEKGRPGGRTTVHR